MENEKDEIQPELERVRLEDCQVAVIIDFETVGFSNKILEIGALRIARKKPVLEKRGEDIYETRFEFQIVEELEVRTNVAWPIGHVSGKKVEERPVGKYSITESVKILRHFIGNHRVIGFNLAYEDRILGSYGLKIYKGMDLMKFLKEKYDLKKYSLGECCRLLCIEEVDAHTALGDCLSMFEIVKREL